MRFLAPAMLLVLAMPAAAEFRSIDGTGNNPGHPEWGSAGQTLRRLMPADYSDGVSEPWSELHGLPSAREVSNALATQAQSIPDLGGASGFLWQWGQFVDHDIDLTGGAAPAEAFPIPVPAGDPFFDPFWTGSALIPLTRSVYDHGSTPRQQLNQITAWIDASNIYGSDDARAAALRGPRGSLRTSPGELLPFNTDGFPNAPTEHDPSLFLSGDVRVNEQNGLTAMHTLFVREHNRLAAIFWDLGFDDETTYQLARAVVSAEVQAITYNEFLPVLLGRKALAPYRGWRNVDPEIANVFSTAAYRLGHSMLPEELLRLDADGETIGDGSLPLKNAFFAPGEILAHGIEPLLRGLAVQPSQAVDTRVVDGVRNFLFGPPGAGGFDLASLNLQRGRDHGLPRYNVAREKMGLPAVGSFAEISSDPDVQAGLAAVYASVDEIDLWIGGLAEDALDDGMLGPLFAAILVDQFERLRDGDRFWYEEALPKPLVKYVEHSTLSEIIQRNTEIGHELPKDVFHARSLKKPSKKPAKPPKTKKLAKAVKASTK